MKSNKQHALVEPSSLDPLKAASKQASAFDEAWLKNGSRLKSKQRWGFLLFSLAFLAAGCFCASGFWANLRAGDPMLFLWAIALIFFFGFGCLGLINLSRFKRG